MATIFGINLSPFELSSVECYAGGDVNVEAVLCGNLECDNKIPGQKKCSGCKLVCYCCVKCQQADWPNHRAACKKVAEGRKKVAALEVAMRGGEIPEWDDNTYLEDGSYERADFFSPQYFGNWWGHLDPRNYCRAVNQLSEEIKNVAWDYEVKHVWKKCLDLKLELLRANMGDNQGIRFEVPAVLLYMNEDDQCFRFIKWHAYNYIHKYQRGYGADETLMPIWSKGEFVYDEAGGGRFDDLYPMVDDGGVDTAGVDHRTFGVLHNLYAGNDLVGRDLSHLVALVVIKLRLVVHLEVQLYLRLKESATADTTSINAQIEAQKRILKKYLHMTHAMNRCLLHILSSEENIGIMRRQGAPDSYSHGSPEEAFYIMVNYCRHFARIPLVGSYGPDCSYLSKFLREIGETTTPNLTYRPRSMY